MSLDPLRLHRPFATALGALLLLAVPAPPAGALSEASLPECGTDKTFVLDLGLPQADGSDPEQLEEHLRTALQDMDHQTLRCPNQPLQVNLTVGTHYQILDWLGQGLLDAAVVPALSHHLLTLDNVAVRELPLSEAGRAALTPAYRSRWESWRFPDAGTATPSRSVESDLEGFLRAIWRPLERRALPDSEPEDADAAAALPPDACPAPPDGYRLALPSHLSTPGFLAPVDEVHAWLEARLAARGREFARSDPYVRECFWRAFFDDVCFYFEHEKFDTAARLCPLRAGEAGGVEIRVGREPVSPQELASTPATPTSPARGPVRHRLLLRQKQAQDLFGANASPKAPGSASAPVLPIADASVLPVSHAAVLFGGAPEGDGEGGIPGPFRTLVKPEPYYGVRTFSFSIPETVDLLKLHQQTSRRTDLALVLPGGGVKATYQSRLLDQLYRDGKLRNYRVAPGSRALPVQYVVGTSGGALLGLFVARQGKDAEWNLSEILWHRELADGSRVPLSSSDIFPTTDLPRYLSLVLILLLFSGLLAVTTVPHDFPLDPGRLRTTPGLEPPLPRHPSFRPPLTLALAAVLLSAPLMARWLGGLTILEHTPEIEGLLYAVLVALAMFADQCLVYEPEGASAAPGPQQPRRALVSPILLSILGGLFLLLPSVVRLGPGDARRWLAQPTSFVIAHAVFGITVLVIVLGARRTSGRPEGRSTAGWILGTLLASALAYLAVLSFDVDWLSAADDWPLLLFALGAAVLVPALSRGLSWLRAQPWWQRLSRRRAWKALPHPSLSTPGWLGRAAPHLGRALLVFLVSLLLVDLCRPAASEFQGDPDAWLLLLAESKLRVGTGALLALLGLLLLTVAWTLWLWERAPRYMLRRQRRFVEALLFLIGGLALAAYFILWLWSKVDNSFTLFELTISFWVALLLVTLVLTSFVILWGVLAASAQRSEVPGRGFTGPVSQRLLRTLAFLCRYHPNGHVIKRRFVRIALLAVFGLAWWNLVLAPAVYGNRAAQDYLEQADAQFGGGLFQARSDGGVKRFETRLLAPANALAEKGTHFVLVVPDGEECPTVRRPRGSNASWHRFRALPGAAADRSVTQLDDGREFCRDIELTDETERKVLLSFVFASGSPFPVFPAHAVDLDPSPDRRLRKLLVDGGYSNNVPVEAAAMVEASQMLIVHSSHPLDCEEGGEEGGLGLAGPLIRNSTYLPGFLYERSQQGDRLSRQGAFVTSLAPLCRADWPILTDFSEYRVRELLQAAEEDLPRRIGRVESWGPVEILGGFQIRRDAG